MRQTYDAATLQELADAYGIGPVRESRLFTSGFENSNYFIGTDAGKHVLKIYEAAGMSPESIRFEVSVMDVSFRAGVKSPEVIRNVAGSLTTEHQGKIAILMPFVEGENADKQEIPDAIAAEVGEEMGKMDKACAVFRDGSLTRQGYEFDGTNMLMLEPKLEHLPDFIDRGEFRAVFDSFRELKAAFDALPSGIIHNDVVLHNLLVKDGRLAAIIDFSDMAFSPYIQNVAVAMAQLVFTYNWQPHQAKLFLDAYRRHTPLSPEELSMLYDLTLARYVLAIVEFSYWNHAHGEDDQRNEFIRNNYGFFKKFRDIGAERFATLIA
jgi:Ser/Thr protein kinase RdoA (MazF antagonist)